MTDQPTAPPQVPAPPAKKKGMGVLAWVLIGCLGLLVLGGIVVVAGGVFAVKKVKDVVTEAQENPAAFAERIIELNPALDVVESDTDAGTMTIRNNETGETATFSWEDIQEGRFSFGSGDETVTFDASQAGESGTITVTGAEGESKMTFGGGSAEGVPSWVPIYPGTTPQSNFSMDTGEQLTGSITMTTGDSVAEVMAHYEQEMQDLGLPVQKSTFSGPDGESGMLSGEMGGGSRGINMMITVQDGQTQAVLTYSEKKQ